MDNRFQLYRQIRFQRTYRTLGKMSVWRVALGVALLVIVFLISGVVSQRFAAAGHFRVADALMIYPAWMEKYKPETKAFIEAGVIYQDGDYEAAAQAFELIEDLEAADAMESLSYVKLADEKLSTGEKDAAYEAFEKADISLLSEKDAEEYLGVCAAVKESYAAENDAVSKERVKVLQGILDSNAKSE